MTPPDVRAAEQRMSPAERHADQLAHHAPGLVIIAERWLSIVIAAFLIIAAVLALGEAGWRLVMGVVHDGADLKAVVTVVDHLLLVLMLVEILHTVRQSIEARELQAEPFLIVGLIATVRRILLVTLMSSDASMTPQGAEHDFSHNMIELGVLAGLTAVLIGSLFVARHSRRAHDEGA
ncbi:MAG: hypothetical protein INR64_14240 [Caulobacteraceae bacterium]|nr:hypothetical protein [Caulobacter sp.]